MPFAIDLLINIEIGSAMLRPICFRIIEVILSLLQELLGLSDLITLMFHQDQLELEKMSCCSLFYVVGDNNHKVYLVLECWTYTCKKLQK